MLYSLTFFLQYFTKCTTGPTNPFHGAISFDNIGLAWVAIFLVISLEGWTDVMYFVQDAHSFWNWIYFVCLIVVKSKYSKILPNFSLLRWDRSSWSICVWLSLPLNSQRQRKEKQPKWKLRERNSHLHLHCLPLQTGRLSVLVAWDYLLEIWIKIQPEPSFVLQRRN